MSRVLAFALSVFPSSLALSTSTPLDEAAFTAWERRYDKKYGSAAEREKAILQWKKSAEIIADINSNSTLTWRAGFNFFSDFTREAFAEEILMNRHPIGSANSKSAASYVRNMMVNSVSELPTSFDWREKGAVTVVQDQGSVGTCWAFSAIGNVEGQWFRSQGDLTDLSEEFLVDCDGTHDESHADCGVFGGWPYLAYEYLIASGGAPCETSWPYCSGTGDCYPCMQGPVYLCGPPPYYCDATIEQKCPTAEKHAFISSWIAVSDDESVIAETLTEIGPLSALLDATQLQYYESGVWSGQVSGSPAWAACQQDNFNHAVLIVGYGEENSQHYWIVKNSWGEKWGEEGYFRIVRGSSTCGINKEITTSLV